MTLAEFRACLDGFNRAQGGGDPDDLEGMKERYRAALAAEMIG